MAIEIIIEDGTGVPFANSYASLAEFRAYAAARGITLPVDNDAVSIILIQGYEFIPSYECKFGGMRSFPGVQNNAFPRSYSFVTDIALPVNYIPVAVKVAQFQIAIAAENGVVLFPTQTGPGIKKEVVGPLTTEYDTANWNAFALPVLSNVELTLALLFKDCNCGGFTLKTIRA